jgi:hypothetical protein
MNAVFTIIAKNYLGLAGVLERSVRKGSDCDFFIFIADEWAGAELPASHVLIARDQLNISESSWEKMAFQYNLVEFCTAIKPACFEYLFEKRQYSKVIYADPDVYFFGSPNDIFSQLDNACILLTPHLLRMQPSLKKDYPDHLFLLNGTFNLGFLGLKSGETVSRFLQWWHNRLLDQCYFDNDKGMATDQKWVSLIPSFFTPEELRISLHRGMNVAPWNFDERELVPAAGGWMVIERGTNAPGDPLLFVHFSGFNYMSFMKGQTDHRAMALAYSDYDDMLTVYSEALKQSDFEKYAGLSYSYSQFENGFQILSLQRRIFRRLTDEGLIFPHPFSVGKGSFFEKLKMQGLVDPSRASADKVTNKNVRGFDAKLKYVHLFFRMIQRVIGVRKYSMMIRFLRRFFSEENQAFLLDKEAGKSFK